jgi:hypothetical protein
VKPVTQTPTEPHDYAVVATAYGALAGAVALLAARRRDDAVPTEPAELAVYAAATAGLSRMLAHEKIGSWVREPFVEEPTEGERHPRGHGLRYALGELLSCTRCLGSWSALVLIGLRALAPRPARVIATLLALSATNDVLQATIAGRRAVARRQERAADTVTEQPPPETWRTAARSGSAHF